MLLKMLTITTHPKVMQPSITLGLPVVGVMRGIFAVVVCEKGRLRVLLAMFRRELEALNTINLIEGGLLDFQASENEE